MVGTDVETDTELRDRNPVLEADSEIENQSTISKESRCSRYRYQYRYSYRSLYIQITSSLFICLRVDELSRDVLDVY